MVFLTIEDQNIFKTLLYDFGIHGISSLGFFHIHSYFKLLILDAVRIVVNGCAAVNTIAAFCLVDPWDYTKLPQLIQRNDTIPLAGSCAVGHLLTAACPHYHLQ